MDPTHTGAQGPWSGRISRRLAQALPPPELNGFWPLSLMTPALSQLEEQYAESGHRSEVPLEMDVNGSQCLPSTRIYSFVRGVCLVWSSCHHSHCEPSLGFLPRL